MINKLERKFGRYAIPNLTIYLLASYVIGYMVQLFGKNAGITMIALIPQAVFKGQVWRLVTWIFMPPDSFSILTILMLFIFYQFGTMLERTWGTFKYNLYIFSGVLLTLLGALLVEGVMMVMGIGSITGIMAMYGMGYSTYYISLSIFIAVAYCYPDATVLLYFIIPIKFKWAALIDVAFMIYSCITAFGSGNIPTFVMIVSSLLNCFIVTYGVVHGGKPSFGGNRSSRSGFFGKREGNGRFSKGPVNGSYRGKSAASKGFTVYRRTDGITKHKCAICGRTENDDPSLEFRFCTKCNGNYEYCQDHLYTHRHIN